VNPTTTIFDNHWYFNFQDWRFFDLQVIFVGLSFMPHLTQRLFAAKTDSAARRMSVINVAAGGIIATVPSLLLGVMIRANLTQKYPGGMDTYGSVISELLNRGGFYEFAGVMAGIAAMAAIMSTADSCMIMITNMLVSELLMNWLFIVSPEYKKPEIIKYCAKCSSCGVILMAVLVTLYDSNINSKENKAFVMAIVGMFQSTFMLVPGVLLMTGMFMRNASDWAGIIAIVSGMVVFVWLTTGPQDPEGKLFKYTRFAKNGDGSEASIKTLLLSPTSWVPVWVMVVNTLLCLLPLERVLPKMPGRINTIKHSEDGKCLDYDEILKIMEGTVEPIKEKVGMVCFSLVLFLANIVAPPWFGTTWSGCNFQTYGKWLDQEARPRETIEGCEGFSGCFGVPCWTMRLFVIFLLCKGLVTLMFVRWQTVDQEGNSVGEVWKLDPIQYSKPAEGGGASGKQETAAADGSKVNISFEPAEEGVIVNKIGNIEICNINKDS